MAQWSPVPSHGGWRSAVVPLSAERLALLQRFHEDAGHFGVRRTAALALNSYWWHGLHADTATVVKHCNICQRVRTSFNASHPELNPLPIMGLFYRWGVDLCGPFPETDTGNKYVMVCIEHLSKHIELIPLPSKEAARTADTFAHHVLGRFGASAEVLTDGGSEWTTLRLTAWRSALCRQ